MLRFGPRPNPVRAGNVYYRNRSRNSYTGTIVGSFVLILVATMLFGFNILVGIYPFGPTKQVTATISRTYVDTLPDGGGSAYMVATDVGVYEVEDSFITGIYNSDEIFSKLVQGKTYTLTVKGRRMANILCQEYPGIIKVVPVESVEK